MLPLDPGKNERLVALCRQHRLRRLDLFGSAAVGRFDPASSDLDFVVEFEDLEPAALADAYFGLLEGLEALFGLPVDLVVASAITNPYFREEIEETRRTVFVA